MCRTHKEWQVDGCEAEVCREWWGSHKEARGAGVKAATGETKGSELVRGFSGPDPVGSYRPLYGTGILFKTCWEGRKRSGSIYIFCYY